MKINLTKKNFSLIRFIVCGSIAIYLLLDMILNWKNDLHDFKILALWITVTILYYNNWKTNGKRKNTGIF